MRVGTGNRMDYGKAHSEALSASWKCYLSPVVGVYLRVCLSSADLSCDRKITEEDNL